MGTKITKRSGRLWRLGLVLLAAFVALGTGTFWLAKDSWEALDRGTIYPPRQLMTAATDPAQLALKCAECHQQEYDDWLRSQHAEAQRPVGARDHPAFAGPVLPPGETTIPLLQGGQPGFRNQETGEFFPARAVIGIEPLRQYLLPIGDGRLQIAPLSFDPHQLDWFDAQEPPRIPDDWSFWAHRGMNWNSQCAYCHMTDFEKNYDIATDSYASTWTTMGISCTQCHGDMSAHMSDPENPDLISLLPKPLAMDNCASCHSRREELTGTFGPGEQYENHYRLTLGEQPGIYYADGQVLDENFEHGSLMLSRMGHAGVSCLDCHNPHSGGLVLPVENNSLCMSCHTSPGTMHGDIRATPIDVAAHTFHEPGTEGSRCIDCHMAETTYMVRDPRRDHGFISPDPQLTIEAGIPNSCNRCHTDQSAEWARDWVNDWYGEEVMEQRRSRQRARVVLRAQEGAPQWDPELLEMARTEEIAWWRATLILLMSPWNRRPDVREALEEWLADADAMVRSAAVRALGAYEGPVDFPPDILDDPVRLVRLDAAWQQALRALPSDHLEEIQAYLDNQSDQPAGAMKQAQWALARSDYPSAIAWARKGADWDRSSAGAQETLAMVYYAAGEPAEARAAFTRAVEIEPAAAGPSFSLALLLAEEGDLPGAIAAFEKAVAADEGFGRAWYNLGLAYSEYGDPGKALTALARAGETSPGSADPAFAAATILLRQGKHAEALESVRRALAQDPSHQASARLLRSLERQGGN